MPIRASWAVFPLFGLQEKGEGDTEHACSCATGRECPSAGKHPAYPFGTLKKGEQVSGRAGCGYGIATGERSGIFVLDFDTYEALTGMEENPATPLPGTFTVATARGVHLYFKWPGFRVRNSASELAPGVDVRGDWGFVVAPGSRHKTGIVYGEVPGVEEIADAPAWLLEWPGLKSATRTEAPAGTNAPIPVDVSTEEGQTRLSLAEAYLENEAPCVVGDGGSGQLWKIALYLVRDLELPLDTCRDLLMAPGGYNGRCTPPWSDFEIQHKLENARDNSDRMPGAITMAGFVERAGAIAEARVEEVRAEKLAAPHVYTFDPRNALLQVQWEDAKDKNGNKIVGEDGKPKQVPKKLKKPKISEIVNTLHNSEEWLNVLRYNEFDDRVYAMRPPFPMSSERGESAIPDEDITALRVWFNALQYADPVAKDLASAVLLEAKGTCFHPIRDWLKSMPKPSTKHLSSLAAVLFGDDRAIAQIYVRKQLIAAVARIMDPGCRVDTVLTLVGPKGGEKKSTTIEELHRVPGCSVFRTDLPDLRDFQKVGQALEGVWVAELAELAVARKNDVETLKATLTRRAERYSPKWVKGEIERPRGCVFWASTNEEEFLPKADSAFRRRFWPVIMGKRADIAWLAKHREEIWAEAMALYNAGEAWWFEDEDEADVGRSGVLLEDSWEQGIREALTKLSPLKGDAIDRFLTAKDVYMFVHGLDAKPPSRGDLQKVVEAMAGLGYKRVKGDNARGWRVSTQERGTSLAGS